MREHRLVYRFACHVTGEDDHADATFQKSGLYRQLGHARHLPGSCGIAEIFRAVGKYPVGTCFLKVTAADFGLGDMGGDGEDGSAVAVTVVKAIDQMQGTGATGTEYGGNGSGNIGVCSGGKGARFFVADIDESDFPIAVMNGVDQGIRRIADNSVNAFDTGIDHERDKVLGNGLGHGASFRMDFSGMVLTGSENRIRDGVSNNRSFR